MRRPTTVLGLLVLAAALGGRAPTARAEEGAGRLVFDREEHDFGAAAQEQEVSTEIGYRNEGTGPVEDIKVIPDCGCYGVTLSKERLEPGESGVLKVSFRTLTFSGRVKKRLRVLAKGNDRTDLRILLTVDVVDGVILDPGRIWFGDVLKGTLPTKTVHAVWHKEGGAPFEVTGVEVPGHDFDIRMEPFEDDEWKGTAITLAFKEPPPLGIFSATALVRTTSPDHPRLSLALTANVTGKVWVQSRTIYFGWIPKGTAKSSRLLLRPLDATVDLGEVTARSRAGKVTVEVTKNPRGREGWWEVSVEVPAGTEPGPIDDVVEVRTAVPGEEVTEISIRGEVLPLER